jgi:hypothetical protein
MCAPNTDAPASVVACAERIDAASSATAGAARSLRKAERATAGAGDAIRAARAAAAATGKVAARRARRAFYVALMRKFLLAIAWLTRTAEAASRAGLVRRVCALLVPTLVLLEYFARVLPDRAPPRVRVVF